MSNSEALKEITIFTSDFVAERMERLAEDEKRAFLVWLLQHHLDEFSFLRKRWEKNYGRPQTPDGV